MKKALAPRSFSEVGFTLMEILIVVALLVTLAIALLVTLNPWAQINKGQDAKRKQELTQLGKVFEDYYNDNNCYPASSDVCYDAPVPRPDGSSVCNICGNESTSPDFSPYLTRLPCDPRQPLKKYLYQTDGSSCPNSYRVYTYLSNTADPVTQDYCVTDGTGETDYNWGVASSNTGVAINCANNPSPTPTTIPTQIPTPTQILTPTPTPISSGQPCSSYPSLYVLYNGCQICGTYPNCQLSNPGANYYIDPGGPGFGGCTTACVPD